VDYNQSVAIQNPNSLQFSKVHSIISQQAQNDGTNPFSVKEEFPQMKLQKKNTVPIQCIDDSPLNELISKKDKSRFEDNELQDQELNLIKAAKKSEEKR